MAANQDIDKELADALKAIELMEAQARIEKNATQQNGVQLPAQPVRMTLAADDKKKKEEVVQDVDYKKKMAEAMKDFIINQTDYFKHRDKKHGSDAMKFVESQIEYYLKVGVLLFPIAKDELNGVIRKAGEFASNQINPNKPSYVIPHGVGSRASSSQRGLERAAARQAAAKNKI